MGEQGGQLGKGGDTEQGRTRTTRLSSRRPPEKLVPPHRAASAPAPDLEKLKGHSAATHGTEVARRQTTGTSVSPPSAAARLRVRHPDSVHILRPSAQPRFLCTHFSPPVNVRLMNVGQVSIPASCPSVSAPSPGRVPALCPVAALFVFTSPSRSLVLASRPCEMRGIPGRTEPSPSCLQLRSQSSTWHRVLTHKIAGQMQG